MNSTLLALAASPRVGGHTDRLLEAFLEPLATRFEVRKLHLCRLRINPCLSCGGCLNTGLCVQEDDMRTIYDGLASAAALALASPVYFLGVTAQAKTMIDRCQALWVAKHKLNRPLHPRFRPAAFISAAGQNSPGVFDCPLKTVRAFLAVSQFRLSASVLESGLDEVASPETPASMLEEARRRGEMMLAAIALSTGGAGQV